MAKRHFTIYCDESTKHGRYFSNFYGGALVRTEDRQAIETVLRAKQFELNIHGEMKWTKITSNYQDKYIDFISCFFDFIRTNRIRIRIMFTHNYRKANNLTDVQKENQYFILYYLMIKHAFGLQYSNSDVRDQVFISTMLDEIPHNSRKFSEFREYINSIQKTSEYRGRGIFFPRHDIANVKSHDHVILQGLDIILGAMQFRLNDLHKEIAEGQMTRSNRTIAKEKVYKEISRQIRLIYPNFNIGTTTGCSNGPIDRWEHRYRHWCFVPNKHEIDPRAVKPRRSLRQ